LRCEKDYDAWKPAFDEHQPVREQHGGRGHQLYRPVDDPNSVVIVSEFATAEGARAFMSDPSLPDAMDRGGVAMPSNVWLCDEIESLTY
jgi:heme-degrading monooxygenase HmoA